MTSSIASRIEASFRKQGLMTTLGARITRIEPGCVEITAPLTPATQQQQGFAHAGLIQRQSSWTIYLKDEGCHVEVGPPVEPYFWAATETRNIYEEQC